MKRSWKQLQERYGSRHVHPSMLVYEQTLRNLVDATGDGKSYRDDPRPLTTRLQANEVYGVKCPDNDHYFRSVMLKRNDLSGKFQVFISNPVAGDIPPGMPEASQEQVFKQIRQMNAGLVMDAELKAFPFNTNQPLPGQIE